MNHIHIIYRVFRWRKNSFSFPIYLVLRAPPPDVMLTPEEKFRQDRIKKYREKVKYPNSPSRVPLKRLWYLGSHYPEGYSPENIKDDAWDFPQEMIDSVPIIGIPITVEHKKKVEIGKVIAHLKSPSGRQYHIAYIDDNTFLGHFVQHKIKKNEMMGLSMMSEMGYLGKSLTDKNIKKVMVPLHMTIAVEPVKPNCRIYGYYIEKNGMFFFVPLSLSLFPFLRLFKNKIFLYINK